MSHLDRSAPRPGGWRHVVALGVASGLLIAGPSPLHAEPAEPAPSLQSHTPLPAGGGGVTIGGGLAVVLPMLVLEGGLGLGGGVDLVGRYASVLGVLHLPELGARWTAPRVGDLQAGVRLVAAGTLFGLAADHVNLTSTLYLATDVGLTWYATSATRVALGVGGELDLVDLRVVDDEDDVEATARYDATVGHAGFQTTFTEELDIFVTFKLRVPTETFRYEATTFLVLPLLEAGATWSFP